MSMTPTTTIPDAMNAATTILTTFSVIKTFINALKVSSVLYYIIMCCFLSNGIRLESIFILFVEYPSFVVYIAFVNYLSFADYLHN